MMVFQRLTVAGCECQVRGMNSVDISRHRDRNWIQLAKQLAWIVTGLSWTSVVTYAIMFVSRTTIGTNTINGLKTDSF